MSDQFTVPNFVRASSKSGLVRAMMRNNHKDKNFYRYFDIQFADGEWVAWYLQELDKHRDEAKEVQSEDVNKKS
jgi:hypothetical protein